jgi:hypothetical protein
MVRRIASRATATPIDAGPWSFQAHGTRQSARPLHFASHCKARWTGRGWGAAPRSSARRPLEGAGVGVGDQLGGRVRAGVGQLTGDRALHQARHGAHRRLPVTREIQS